MKLIHSFIMENSSKLMDSRKTYLQKFARIINLLRNAFVLLLTVSVFFTDMAYADTSKVTNDISNASDTVQNSTLVKHGYVHLQNGLHMYYEIHGKGAPLVLLHGGFMDIASWGPTLSKLAETRQVIAFDLEGHGRTADLDRPLSWNQMADDVATAITKLGYKRVDVMGYSLGGVITLRMGMKYPALVRKLIPISAIYSDHGYYPAITSHWPNVEDFKGSEQEQEYIHVAPNPSHWPVFFGKMRQELINFKGWSKEDVSSIKAPTLIIFGDNDAVLPEHELELFKLLGGNQASGGFTPLRSQLAMLPNTTHFDIYLKANQLSDIIEPFLNSAMPK